MYILNVKEDGAWKGIPAIKGDRGDTGKFKYANVTLEAALWSDGASPYTQTVNIDGVGENTCVNLCPDANNLQAAINEGYLLTVVNNNGVVTFYSVGSVPQTDITLQVQIVEVEI